MPANRVPILLLALIPVLAIAVALHASPVVMAPVIVLLVALAILKVLSRKNAQPFDLSKFLSDLPSLIAILIVTAICLLPLSGLEVPEVLNNVALVVVGFYFGKRTSGTAIRDE